MISHQLVPRSLSVRGVGPGFGRLRVRSLDRLLEDLWSSTLVTPSGSAPNHVDYAPRVDIDESATEVRVSAELPGLDANDVEVVIDENVSTIKGERTAEREENREGYYHVESTRGSFHRAIRLPFEAAAEDVTASYKHGVLEVTVAKPAEEKSRARVIPVTGS